MNLTDQLIDLVYNIRYEDITDNALEKLRVCLTDTLGVTLAGAADLKVKEERLLNLIDDGSQVVAPVGLSQKTSLAHAILVNGLSAHFLELDDGVRYGVIHPSAPLFAALIPIATVKGVSWEQFVLGAICGYETSIRLASAMQPSHYSRGYHPTATCCTLGVAVGIAVMLGYSKAEVKDAFSAASISAAGSLKVLENVSELKPYNCAKASLMGYFAAMMAKAGFKGPEDPLSGETGFLNMMSDACDEDRLLAWDGAYAIEKVYLKPYASCRHTHPEIEAAFVIRQKDGFDAKEINAIRVKTYKGVISKHDFNTVYGESSARMSIPYSLAVALVTGKAGIAEFTEEYIKDPLIQRLTKLAVIEGDEELSRLVPDKRVAIVTVEQTDGKSFVNRVEYPKGEPENPLSEDELLAKFLSMTEHAGMNREQALQLFQTVMNENIDFRKLRYD
jgi:2-methylcitrate dehydratase PrpD